MNPAAPPDGDLGESAGAAAECAVLGIILFDNSVYPTVQHLKPESFGDPFRADLWSMIGETISAGRVAEPIMLMERFRRHAPFEDVGGLGYLADLVSHAPPPAYASHYASEVMDSMIRRALAVFGQDLAGRASRPDGYDAGVLLSDVRRRLDEIEAGNAADDATMISAPDAADRAIAQMEENLASGKPRGLMTGLRCVDRRLNGLKPGSLIIVGGRPGMCKTGLGRAIASGGARHNPEVDFLFLSIEMGPDEMMERELSAQTFVDGEGVQYRDMEGATLTPLDMMNIKAARRKIPPNLILDDCQSLGLEDVRRKIWSRKRRGRRLGAVVIDYLQLMRRAVAQGRNEASVLAEITSGLKQLARQAGCAIILLSQLSRKVEDRDNKWPQLSDLRESGAIEQDADAVLFPFREFYYVERAEPKQTAPDHLDWEMRCADLRTRLDVICAKQRKGPIGTDRQVYQAEYDHIEDYEET